jgi:flagellin
MYNNVPLSEATRKGIRNIQALQSKMEETQTRIATGLKVNSALDNPSSYFTASNLNARGNALSSLLNDVTNSAGAIQAAQYGATSIDSLLQSAKALAQEAITFETDTEGLSQRANYASQINTILEQVDQIAQDASYQGVNLLAGGSKRVSFNENSTTFLDLQGTNLNTNGLSLTGLTSSSFSNDTEITTALTKLDSALASVSNFGNRLNSNFTTLSIRDEFTRNMIDTLYQGASDLTVADTDQESAVLLALQTQLSVARETFSLTSSADTGVLRLFS